VLTSPFDAFRDNLGAGLFALKKRPHRLNESRRCQSVVTSKTLPDLIKPSVKRVKSGMKAFVVKMKYITNHENPKKPVVTI
jgi:hypothetical protein